MLWRRYYPEKEAFGEAERREKADAADWECGDTAEGFYECFEAG